ncbi:GNAT family N-acetyltransferase [Phytoactinopolyspora endophytica]|uniref:GNAT family N-acetyltransferase n=1 Tax=Phytoactinopolyspora endophytica TaxID=1642495 RepID=UPI00101D1690|nr:GNAT family N-acetyltransferase [Phytoactinopolyspora endophytica]
MTARNAHPALRTLSTVADVAAISGDDAIACWAAQRLGNGGAAHAYRDAVAVVAPELNRWDRLIVRGPVEDAVELVARLIPGLPHGYRVQGAAHVIRAALERIPQLDPLNEFGWMETTTCISGPIGSVAWLDDDAYAEAAELVTRVYPTSYAVPGVSPEQRWAAVRGADGRLAAVAADACTGGGVGFIAGVVTDTHARGAGHGRAVTAFVTKELLAQHGRVALVVDSDNDVAISLYRRLGYTFETIAAARVS